MASESALSVCNILVKWSGNEYVVKDISVDASVQELKEKLFQQTGVKPERQKLLGLKCKGRIIIDTVFCIFKCLIVSFYQNPHIWIDF